MRPDPPRTLRERPLFGADDLPRIVQAIRRVVETRYPDHEVSDEPARYPRDHPYRLIAARSAGTQTIYVHVRIFGSDRANADVFYEGFHAGQVSQPRGGPMRLTNLGDEALWHPGAGLHVRLSSVQLALSAWMADDEAIELASAIVDALEKVVADRERPQ